MKISYDSEIDALYIRFVEGKHECRTVRLNEEVALNIGAGEKLVGIEILDAKEVLGSGKVPSISLEGLEVACGYQRAHQGPSKALTAEAKVCSRGVSSKLGDLFRRFPRLNPANYHYDFSRLNTGPGAFVPSYTPSAKSRLLNIVRPDYPTLRPSPDVS